MDPNAQFQTVATPQVSAGPQPAQPRTGRFHLPFRRGAPKPEIPAGEMTLVGHLVELRNRIFISVFSLIPGTIVGFIFSDQIVHVLRAPLPTKDPLMTLSLMEPFLIKLEVSLVCGVILAMPVILFEFWRFISPGLTPKERSAARPWIPLALLFFCVGVGLAYFILPYASGFLYAFQSPDIQLHLTAEAYFGFVTTLFLVFGLVMEFPIILVILSKVGIVTSKGLRSSRRMAILGVTIFSALVTPGADLVSPIAMAVTMYGLYEVSIVLIRLTGH